MELSRKAPVTDRKVFHPSNKSHYEDKYFLDSANKIGYFFEADAIDANGELKSNETHALNKVRIQKKKEKFFNSFRCKQNSPISIAQRQIGHALHLLHPTFKKYTFDRRMQNVAKTIGFRKPSIVQSMIIYKNPKIGSSGELNKSIQKFIIMN